MDNNDEIKFCPIELSQKDKELIANRDWAEDIIFKSTALGTKDVMSALNSDDLDKTSKEIIYAIEYADELDGQVVYVSPTGSMLPFVYSSYIYWMCALAWQLLSLLGKFEHKSQAATYYITYLVGSAYSPRDE